ncbi:NADH-quinone oxidoreductase subunit M [Planctomycetes bacterium Pan216]|uniref:NADH-quinone oxidoreductase subunit M n=1 Tax=Kolteria novifilia TaxID=2527975 RepID=A0A518B1B5_9BACT|nr:NADH-quinone oxidoreductase subunit M [Planctomycetes bacterium Pan216]
MIDTVLLTLILFLPALGAAMLALPFFDSDEKSKHWMLINTIATFGLTLLLLGDFLELTNEQGFVPPLSERALATADGQNAPNDLVVRVPWISSSAFNIEYYLGVDGISLSLIVLTGLISVLGAAASFSVKKFTRGYCILFLLLETGMMGVFLSLDFFLFYIFWEVMLLPMYFLIGIWGGPRREYAAIKFFLYTLFGGVLMLIAMLGFYFNSDPNTFDIIRLQQIGQTTGPDAPFSPFFQRVMFVLLFIGFAIKLPAVPFHTWLPDAHVEAPTPISMILAGVLLKMGGYGLIRIAYPICPDGAYFFAVPVAVIGVVSIIYGAFAAMAQQDFKKLVAYSSVSHMGYVTLGIAVLPILSPVYYTWGMAGAMFQMIAHGISSAGMFFLVGVIYERAHHRDLNRFGGLMNIMPVYGALSIVIFFAGMGLPGLCGFPGEIFTVLAGFKFGAAFGIIAAFGVILTAGYILWTVQRVYLGSNKQYEGTPDITTWETLTVLPLVFLSILLGVYPDLLLGWMAPDVEVLVRDLTDYGRSLTDVVTAAK